MVSGRPRPASGKQAAIGAVALFLPAGLLLSAGFMTPNMHLSSRLLATDTLRAAAVADQLALITLASCVTGLIAVMEWQALFPGRRDYLALASFPVRPRQIFMARFASVLLSAVVIAAINILPSLIAPMEFGGARELNSPYLQQILAEATACGLHASLCFSQSWHCRACC